MEPFTLHVSQTFTTQGIVTQASDGLHMTPHPSAVPQALLSAPQACAGLFMAPWSSAAPSFAPLALSASLAAPQFSAASGGAPLAFAHLTLSPLCLRDPAWLRSPPRFRPLTNGHPLTFSPNYRTLYTYLLFCILLRFRLTLLSIVGPPLALPMVVGQPRTLPLFRRPRVARTLLCWPSLALMLLRIHPLDLGFLLRLWSFVQCRSLRGPQLVALRCLNVRRSGLLPFLIMFPPGFRLSTPGCMFGLRLYITICCLYWLFCPGTGDAVRSPLSRCHGVRVYVLHGEVAASSSVFLRSLFILFWFIVFCVSQPKISHVVVLYLHTGSAEFLRFLRNSSSHFPGLCRLVLTCSHDSLFLRYPAIDIVWRSPVFLTLGFLRHLALRGSAWWFPGPGWCSHQSFSRTSVLPFLTLTRALTVYNTPPVVSVLASSSNGEFVTVLCLRSHHCLTVSGSTGQWCPMMRNWECGGFLLRLPVRVPPCLPFGLATLWLGRCIPVSGSTGQWYPWMMSAAVCGCSSHPAVTLRVDGSLCMWPIRSSQGVPTTG